MDRRSVAAYLLMVARPKNTKSCPPPKGRAVCSRGYGSILLAAESGFSWVPPTAGQTSKKHKMR